MGAFEVRLLGKGKIFADLGVRISFSEQLLAQMDLLRSEALDLVDK